MESHTKHPRELERVARRFGRTQTRRLTRSYVQGATTEPLLGDTIDEALKRTVRRQPDMAALIVPHQSIRWTWSELDRRVATFAAGLRALGLKKGERLGIWAPNRFEWIVVQLATARIGVILVNINPAYRIGELEYALNQVGCKALVTASAFKKSRYLETLEQLLPEVTSAKPGALKSKRVPSLEILIRLGEEQTPGYFNYSEVDKMGMEALRKNTAGTSPQLQFDDAINIQFTSGTTGMPKAATLTHHNIVNNAYLAGVNMQFSARDRLCIPVPMYHCFGMVLGVLVCITHGATMVLPSEGFDAEETLDTIESEGCTALHGVPTMFIAELEALKEKRTDVSTLRTGIMAGAPCPIELMKRVIHDLHVPEITIGYGMTETSPLSFQTHVDDPIERRVSTVGRILPHTEVKIVDEENNIVPPDVSGELLTRGYCVMRGYWNDPEHTAASIDDARWMHSGDMATIDEQGYCNIVGRLKDMVIRGGENIYPREIEEFIYQHPQVEAVEVFGVPSEKYGEELCAWVKIREGEKATGEEIQEFCAERIAYFKVPRYVRLVDEFPTTITGKVQKFKMREIMAEELGLKEEDTA